MQGGGDALGRCRRFGLQAVVTGQLEQRDGGTQQQRRIAHRPGQPRPDRLRGRHARWPSGQRPRRAGALPRARAARQHLPSSRDVARSPGRAAARSWHQINNAKRQDTALTTRRPGLTRTRGTSGAQPAPLAIPPGPVSQFASRFDVVDAPAQFNRVLLIIDFPAHGRRSTRLEALSTQR